MLDAAPAAADADAAADAQRLTLAWHLTCGRAPTPEDRSEAEDFLRRYRQTLAATGASSDDQRVGAWRAYARVLLTSNEFLYVD